MQRRSYQRLARRAGQGVEKLLGALEADIMEQLWAEGRPLTVREMLTRLNAGRARPVAYTTVMTVMARLVEKGLLERTLVGQAHEYRAALSREAFLRRVSETIAQEMIEDFGEVAVAGFLTALERLDPERRQELRRYLEAEDHQR